MRNLPQIMKMTPHVAETIWGGKRLRELKNLGNYGEDSFIGETWEISDLPQGSASHAGNSLGEIYKKNKKYFLGEHDSLSYLVKFIDTTDNLSVQVHPDDKYAQTHENSSGKTECWIILDAKEGCGIYLGLNKGVDREQFEQSLVEGKDMSSLLQFHQVKRGDFFFVPAGTVHAIGNDVTLVEIQQSSGITYRVWDWNRVDAKGKGRQLHVKQAMDVIEFSPAKNTCETFLHRKEIFKNSSSERIVEHYDFVIDKFTVKGLGKIDLSKLPQRVKSIVCLDGEINVKRGGECVKIKNYFSALLPLGGESQIEVSGKDGSTFLVVS